MCWPALSRAGTLSTGSPASSGAMEMTRCVACPSDALQLAGKRRCRRRRRARCRPPRAHRIFPASASCRRSRLPGRGGGGESLRRVAGAEDEECLLSCRAPARRHFGDRPVLRQPIRPAPAIVLLSVRSVPRKRREFRPPQQPRKRPHRRAAHQRRRIGEQRPAGGGQRRDRPNCRPRSARCAKTGRGRCASPASPKTARGTPHRPASAVRPAPARADRRAPQLRLGCGLRELVPWAGGQAVVAAIDAVADRLRGIRAGSAPCSRW